MITIIIPAAELRHVSGADHFSRDVLCMMALTYIVNKKDLTKLLQINNYANR